VGFSDHKLSDTVLTALLRDGDQKAFAQLYHQYSGKLYLNVLKMVKDEQVAEELIQELFAKIWHKRAEINIDTDFLAYLYRSAQNLVHDFSENCNAIKKCAIILCLLP
jgi:RNA polymerase sigma factor (sigma-70 family)